MKKLLILLLLLFAAPLALAETVRYVTDSLEVPLRASAGSTKKILKMLPSGTAVQVLQENKKSGYSLVRVSEGNARGWILTQQLMDTPGIRQNLASVQKASAEVAAENERLKQELAKLVPGGGGDVTSRLVQLNDENQRLRLEVVRIRKLSNSDLIDLDEQNRRLQEQIVNLERDLQLVRQEKQALADSRENTLFLLGAGLLLSGLIFGWLLPGRSAVRQQHWSDL